MLAFQYHPDLLAHYPNLVAGVILGQGMVNAPSPNELQELFLTQQKETLARLGATPLSELETLSAWRAAFRAFGVNPTKYRSAPEALLRRLTKKGDIPSINILVDCCNLVSIRYTLPVAAFDPRALQGGITVRFASGSERFTPLGESLVEHPETGEVIFVDETDLVVARRWCWRQSEESAAQERTREAIFTIEAQHHGSRELVANALNDLNSLLREFVGGAFQSDLLDLKTRAISWKD